MKEKYQNYQKQIFVTKHDQNIEEDRISNLPDAVLQHILGSIELKQAVQTSILSKRWKNLWSSLPDLDFDFKRFAGLNDVDLLWPHQNRRFMPRFTDYVSHFLSHRDDASSIRKF
ncbi:hypothetical protein BUALT_Bualt08G0123300 [Buddleja alternifolia]|uniref:F-box domain-containing protein n=1 Tax=Buddleja alternifolia TaxID=168488 RepID=A0AAV6XE28_9LAMI|nr:hypothetical protein BUALT_Bualt08G0123300 [Buddleja alternifolia]